MMFLVIDVGNSETACALCDDDRFLRVWRFKTLAQRSDDEYRLLFESLFSFSGYALSSVTAVVISNVVPASESALMMFCRRCFSIVPLQVSASLRGLPPILLDNPQQAGGDRLANATALARGGYGFPSMAIDFGTATTFDILDKDGAYRGGAICAGFGATMASLAAQAARLSDVSFSQQPIALVGTTTEDALRSGLYWGYVSLIEGMLERFKRLFGDSLKVVICGGFAEMFYRHFLNSCSYDADLTLKGMVFLYKDNR